MMEGNASIEPMDGSMVEGVGDEVLVALLFGFITVLLAVAWHSTNLTYTQTRLTAVRVHRRAITLNRVPGSSTSEIQSSPQTPAPEESTSTTHTTQPDVAGTITTEGVVAQASVNTAEAPPTSNDSAPVGVLSANSDENLTSDVVLDNNAAEASTVTTEDATSSSNDGTTSTHGAPVIDTITSVDAAGNSETGDEPSETPNVPQEESEQGQSVEDAAAPSSPDSTTEDNTMRIRIKFLNEEEKLVRAPRNDTVANFKRCNFATELSDNKLVRLIFNGQVLEDDKTLQSYNITDSTTIHALITDIADPGTQSSTQPNVVVFNAGVLLVPLFTVVLLLLWYVRLEYPELFNITSTMSLTSITVVFLYCMYAQARPRRPRASQHRHYGFNIGATTTRAN